MMTSYFTPEVKIRPFRACAIKNTPSNAYLWPSGRHFRILKEIGGGNAAVLRMRKEKYAI